MTSDNEVPSGKDGWIEEIREIIELAPEALRPFDLDRIEAEVKASATPYIKEGCSVGIGLLVYDLISEIRRVEVLAATREERLRSAEQALRLNIGPSASFYYKEACDHFERYKNED